MGQTKHVGGWTATQELAGLCHLQEGQEILYVGCGAGTAATTIALEYKCHLIGVDLLETMVEALRETTGESLCVENCLNASFNLVCLAGHLGNSS